MSFNLTNRDTAVKTLTMAQLSPEGPIYAVGGNTPGDNISARARFTNVRGSAGRSRSNLNVLRQMRDASGKVWNLQVDITIAMDNGSPFTIDDCDDLVTWATSYFDAEATTGDFVLGLARS